MTTKDPVVQDLTEWINRSAGQHQRRVSEGTESAARLLRLPVRQMTPDPYLLHRTHRVDTHDLGADDGVSVGYCRTDIEFAGPEPEYDREFHDSVRELQQQGQAAFVIVMMILALAVIAFYSFTA